MIITYNRVGTDHLLLSMEEYKKIDAYIAKDMKVVWFNTSDTTIL